MNTPMLLLVLAFVGTIVFQAIRPRHRLAIVLAGCAACSVIAISGGNTTMVDLWKDVPWNVMAILVALGLFTQAVLPSNAMGFLALRASSFSKGRESRLLWVFPAMMFVLSGTVNNLAAMQLVLPVLLAILKILAPQQRYVDMLLASLLVACNLGGAATPIGDFPAILLMGHGGVEFITYLVWAGPACVLILAAVLLAFILLHQHKKPGRADSAFEESLAVATVARLYRKTHIRWSILLPAIIVFAGMFACWTMGVEPDLVCIVGIGVLLLASGDRGEKTIRTGIEVEPVVFLNCLFIMIAAVTASGILDVVTEPILQLSHDVGHRVIVVTTRTQAHERPSWWRIHEPDRVLVQRFLRRYRLPVKHVAYTSHQPKITTLLRHSIELHYDDDPAEEAAAVGTGVHIVLLNGVTFHV